MVLRAGDIQWQGIDMLVFVIVVALMSLLAMATSKDDGVKTATNGKSNALNAQVEE